MQLLLSFEFNNDGMLKKHCSSHYQGENCKGKQTIEEISQHHQDVRAVQCQTRQLSMER